MKLGTIDTSVRYKYSTITGTGIVHSTLGDIDFLDFVPIENNSENFDLNAILNAFDQDSEQNKQQTTDKSTKAVVMKQIT